MTIDEVENALPGLGTVQATLSDFKEQAAAVDEAQVEGMDSFVGRTFESGAGSFILLVIDFESRELAEERLRLIVAPDEVAAIEPRDRR